MRGPRTRTWSRLTKKERDAIIDALGFVTAGLDPWEGKEDEDSEAYKACWTAWVKLTGRDNETVARGRAAVAAGVAQASTANKYGPGKY